MKEFRKKLIEMGIMPEQIKAEMAWLRSIDMDSDRDVIKAVFEIKESIHKGVHKTQEVGVKKSARKTRKKSTWVGEHSRGAFGKAKFLTQGKTDKFKKLITLG